METPIISSSVSGVGGASTLSGSQKSNQTEPLTKGFKEILDSLNQSQATSDDLIKKLAAGEDVDVHEVMTAFEETDINFRVSMAIRDRLVDAYQQVTRMQI